MYFNVNMWCGSEAWKADHTVPTSLLKCRRARSHYLSWCLRSVVLDPELTLIGTKEVAHLA